MTTVVYDTQCEIPSHTGPILRPVSMNDTNSFLSSLLTDFYFQTPSHSAALPQLRPSSLSRPSLIQACGGALPLVKPGGTMPASLKGLTLSLVAKLWIRFSLVFYWIYFSRTDTIVNWESVKSVRLSLFQWSHNTQIVSVSLFSSFLFLTVFLYFLFLFRTALNYFFFSPPPKEFE